MDAQIYAEIDYDQALYVCNTFHVLNYKDRSPENLPDIFFVCFCIANFKIKYA